ncbi:aspartate aminotransferase family protein [Aquimarina muelleri]|uniref:Diaminobutyrate--2-oxoglutarate aminotransferase n=1 Tax=Aquimarina muelleri TaxID=279356 RepID=A0A918N5X5_9FLAO|nr:aspartate aminotransferase family protein [Aquimarina muelleri]MCX2764857.1 aspartate aminotransferase family protein [Aquimarina muelleri]GGX34312.1 diaminobutyrate--2-oxoglutarate aminotransferase [Aquimarina muelleri]
MESLKKYHLSERQKIISSSIPGPKSEKLLKLQEDIEGSVVSYPKNMPIAIKRAKGSIIEDVDGNQFIDFFGGCGVLNVGHGNDFVLEYVKEQQADLIHALDFPTENKLSLIQKILNKIPEEIQGDYKVSFGGPTGSDAVEAAIKLAKIKTGRDGVIAFSGGYHGMTSGALAVTSDTFFRKKLTSLIPNIHFVPYSYCYRCPFNKEESNCNYDCAKHFEWILETGHSGINIPAAIILEPLQGEGGNVVPKDGFLERIVKIAHKHDIIVIFDEIQSGFYRTGSFLEFMNTKAIPDIITFSKGFGGIGFPISGLIYRKDIEAWKSADHIGTFRGNQVSIAAARGAFDFIEQYNIEEYTKLIGEYLMKKLKDLALDNPFIGEVRGKGMMIGVEFVKDKITKEPFPEFLKKFRSECFQRGLLFEVGGHYNNVLRLVPPLITTHNIINAALEIMKEATVVCMKEYLKLS